MMIIAAALLCGTAAADTIVVNGVDNSRGESVWMNENGADVDAFFAGVILIELNTANGSYFRDTLCVQLFTDIYLYQEYGTTVVAPDSPAQDRVSWLVDNELPTIVPTVPASIESAEGAGLQLAIWDLIEDGGDGFLKGKVQEGSAANPTDATVLFWAETYRSLALMPGHSSSDAFVYLNVNLGNGSPAQDLEGPAFHNDGGPQPAPEASTLVLAGTALAALGLVGRRKTGMLGDRSAKR